ncbi:MAG: FAD-binding oxidoreductase [Microbacterium sp.]
MTDVLELLRDALGPRVDTAEETLAAARADRSGHLSDAPPLAVVHAESVEDVQAVMRIASETGTPVVPQGAMTGLAGAGNAGAGQIALSTRRMTRIHEVSIDDRLAVVEPGILNADLNAQLAEHGLWWAPDPASRDISTVGGNIATGAGGLLCAKYGVVREAVLGLDVVLADGRLIRMGHRSVKGVTGLDLVSLMIGSEGRLGIVVGATLKLRPLVPGTVCTVSATFPSVRATAAAAAAVTASGIQPSVMELMDSTSLAAACRYLGLPEPGDGASHLIVQTDDIQAPVDADGIAEVLRGAGGAVTLTHDPEEGERLLAMRRAANPAMAAVGNQLIEDVSVPRTRLAEMFDEIERIEREHDVIIPTIAHAGDGNLHPSFVFQGDTVPEHIWTAADDMFRSAIRLGGTLTGEHGIGVLKARWLADELGDDQWELQRRIVLAFDPQGILNPGKVFVS